ncbi:hypothetical protein EH223_12300 [candidate division KSB1 bacterium]|nr:hypothetical protein [candidate division KSB1 bacterium]RQW02606.1 MAG: hypothetical protein EH223_12300 [candidate division KSB1 bacterium]
MKTRKKGYGILLSLTIIITLAALWTIVPQATASKVCLIGYKAHCTFTPISTIVCLLLAAATCKIRKKKFTT